MPKFSFYVRLFCIALVAITVSCRKPTLQQKSEKEKWSLENRSAEIFVYVDYHWKGGKFDDAVKLEKDICVWGKEQGFYIYAMGRYPTGHDWQLGFVATNVPESREFQGRPVNNMDLPAGRYAVLDFTGHTDHMYYYWKKFKQWLKAAGDTVAGPTIEVYPDIFTKEMSDPASKGQLRLLFAK
jgi:hypothetical protein